MYNENKKIASFTLNNQGRLNHILIFEKDKFVRDASMIANKATSKGFVKELKCDFCGNVETFQAIAPSLFLEELSNHGWQYYLPEGLVVCSKCMGKEIKK